MPESDSVEFEIGDIVALKSHPYFDNLTSIVISGEPQLVPPLMVIVERLNDTRDQYDEKTGEEISKKGNAQCKCIWYSNKSLQFEESWVSSKLLKHIVHNVESPKNLDDLDRKKLYGKLAVLKTARLEGGKQKSSISIESNSSNSNKDKVITNPLLSFLSPVLQIVQVIEAKNEVKEPTYDQKTGKAKRFYPKYIVKCKWFNPNDKFSERLFPLECLEILPDLSLSKIKEIQLQITSSGFYLFKNSIIQPQKIYSLNGIYFLKAFDYVVNKTTEIEITTETDFEKLPDLTINEAPSFDFVDGEVLPDDHFNLQYIDAIKDAQASGNYIRIKYTNQDDDTTTRTIKEFSILNIKEGKEDAAYLRGYCMTRRDTRNFRVDRIKKLEVLNLKF